MLRVFIVLPSSDCGKRDPDLLDAVGLSRACIVRVAVAVTTGFRMDLTVAGLVIPVLLRVCCAADLSYQSFTHLSVVGVVVIIAVVVVAVVGSGSSTGSGDMDVFWLNFTLVGVC